MKRLPLIAFLLAPGAALADKASTCVTVIRALEEAGEAVTALDGQQADALNEMLALRDRIEGYGGALVELRATQDAEAYAAARGDVTRSVNAAMQAIMDYCS